MRTSSCQKFARWQSFLTLMRTRMSALFDRFSCRVRACGAVTQQLRLDPRCRRQIAAESLRLCRADRDDSLAIRTFDKSEFERAHLEIEQRSSEPRLRSGTRDTPPLRIRANESTATLLSSKGNCTAAVPVQRESKGFQHTWTTCTWPSSRIREMSPTCMNINCEL